MTSEPPEVSISISSSVDVTTALQTGRAPVSLASPMIVRATLLLVCAVINVCGNGFTLIAIRMTPRLWTKTNFILASMLLSKVVTGVFVLWYTPLLVVVHVFNNPCRYNVLLAVLTALLKMTAYVSSYHVIPVSVERYIAIVYPLHYESKSN